MNSFKIIFISILFILLAKVSVADNHDAEQNIIERAKEINQQQKKNKRTYQNFCRRDFKV